MSARIADVLAWWRAGGTPTGLYAVGTRVVNAVVSLIGGILILVLLDPDRIGVFLSFNSLAGFTVVADLGLTYSFLLAVSSRPANEAPSVASTAFAAAVPTVFVAGLVLFLAGSLFMMQGDVSVARWLWPWIAFCAISSVQLLVTLGLTYVEGTGGRHAAWRANFWIEVAAGLAFIAAVAAQVELWAVAAAAGMRVLVIVGLFFWRFDLPARVAVFSRFALWRDHLWPMQWKTLINNIVGVSTTKLLTPVLLAAQGSLVAGQVGLVLALNSLIITVTSVWPLSQTAVYARLYHQGDYRELHGMFRRTFLASLALCILFAFGCGSLLEVLRAYSPHVAERFPSSIVIWIILVAIPLGHLTICFAIAVRAQREDPVVVPNMLLAIPALALLFIAAQKGTVAFALGVFGTMLIFLLLYSYFFIRLLQRLRKGA